jgi:tetratricopeptide (TPR) repeat protein
MNSGWTFRPLLLLLLLVFQSPQDTIRQHYEAAEGYRRAGNPAAAETEYTAILVDGYDRLGKIYTAQRRHKEAITALAAAALYRPDSPQVLLDLAIAYFDAEQFEKALEPLRKILTREPQNAGARQMLGKTYFMLGDLSNSSRELQSALSLDPNNVDVAYTLGIAYLRNRQVAAAKELYDRLLKQLGDQPELHIVIGRAYREAGFLPDAIAEFRKAISLNPAFPRAHYSLGLTYLLDEGQSKLSEALEEFRIELAANPNEFYANYYLGIVYIFQRKWDLAIDALQRAATVQPNNPDPYFQLGQAYQELGRHEQAIEALKKTIALNPYLAHNKYQVTTAHHRLAQSLLKIDQSDAGRKELQLASDLKTEAFKMEQESYRGAARMGASTLPGQDNSLPDKGSVAGSDIEPSALDEKAKRELKGSEAYYAKVVATVHNNIGLLRAERQDFRAAAQQFALAAKWDPQQEGLDYNLGLAYFKSDLYQQALPPLERELKANPNNSQARSLLGLIYLKLEKFVEAAREFERELALNPGDLQAQYHLGYALLSGKERERGIQTLQEVIRFQPDHAEARYELGKALLQQGNVKGALENLEIAAKLDPGKADVHYQLGKAYIAAGRQTEGKSQLQVAKQLSEKERSQTRQ